MTKQEEILEGVEARIRLGVIDTTYETAEDVLRYLHSKGVGIRGCENPRYPGWFKVEPLVEER